MKTRLVRIGNSRGVRLPKPLIEEAGLPEHVELRVRDGTVIIAPATRRAGWAEAAKRAHELGDGQLIETAAPTRFDRAEWRW